MTTENINFTDKVVLVTGSSSGMGAEMLIRFAKLGAKVVVHGRNDGKICTTAEKCKKISPTGHMPLTVKADMTNDEDLKQMVTTIINHYGKLDILVNNAGIIAMSPINDTDLMTKFDAQMNVNVRAVVLLCSLCAPHLIKSKGNIVNISSGIGLRAFPGAIGYSTSKWAVMMVTEGLALELGPQGVRVNSINPGFIENQDWHDKAGYDVEAVRVTFEKANPLGRNGTITDIVNMVIFLSSDASAYVNGVSIAVDGGITKTIQGTK